MKQWLEYYGELPEVVGEFDIDVTDEEMCFVQYLPVYLPNSRELLLPPNLEWCRKLIVEAGYQEIVARGKEGCYVYLTVKRVYGSGNREGWHCDGFGSDDVNYIWYDCHPTEFLDPSYLGLIRLSDDHKESMKEMNELISDVNDKVLYPAKDLIRMTQSSIHRVNPEPCNQLRTFVKISFSDSKYNLKGNAHNYLLDYKWDMVERGSERNDPVQEYI